MASLVAQLAALSQEQLDDAIAAAKAMRQFSNQPINAAAMGVRAMGTHPYDYVLAVACKVCNDLGLDLRSVARAKQLRAYSAFCKDVPDVVTFFEQLGCQNRGEVKLLFEFCYRHMATERDWLGPALTMLLNKTCEIPAVIDRMFPGYYQAGLMHVVMVKLRTR